MGPTSIGLVASQEVEEKAKITLSCQVCTEEVGEKGLSRSQPRRHLDLGLPASVTL